MISEVLGIRPWEQLEQMSGDDLREACAWIDAQNKRIDEAGG